MGIAGMAAFLSCVREDVVIMRQSDPIGVNLTVAFDVNDFGISAEADTRAITEADPEWGRMDANAKDRNIHSLAVFIINRNQNSTFNNRIVAYRIIAPKVSGKDKDGNVLDGHFLDIDPETGLGVDKSGTADGLNTLLEKDDQYYGYTDNGVHYGVNVHGENGACYGYNGFSRMDASGELVKSARGYFMLDTSPGADGGLDEKNPDGLYDYDFTTPLGITYGRGTPMKVGKGVVLSFEYDNPMHGPVEKLVAGTYHVLAIANFRESVSEIFENSGSGLGDYRFSDSHMTIGDHVARLITLWDTENGIQRENYIGFLNGAISLKTVTLDEDGNMTTKENMTSDYIRSKRAQIVSTEFQEHKFENGNNVSYFNLARTLTRVTFEITNNSDEKLRVSEFSLGGHFAQGAAFLFTHEDPTLNYREEWQRQPVVTGGNAFVPFRPGLEIEGAERGVPKRFFDALMYASGVSYEPMTYNLKVEYPECNYEEKKVVSYVSPNTDAVPIAAPEVLNALVDTKNEVFCFLAGRRGFIRYNSETGVVSADSDKTSISSFSFTSETGNSEEALSFLWQLTPVTVGGTKKVCIKNALLDKYLVNPASTDGSGGRVYTYTDKLYQATPFEIKSFGTKTGVAFVSQIAGKEAYLHQWNSNDGEIRSIYNWGDDNGSHFSVYEINGDDVTEDTRQIPVSKTLEDFTIKAHDLITGVADSLYYLRRNDHLTVNIGVTYNKMTQDVEFQVKPWVEKDNEVVFE